MRNSITLYAQWIEVIDGGTALETENHIVYVYGYPDGTVRADNAITRAEAATIFYRLLQNQGTAKSSRFNDVGDSEWYAQAVNYLTSTGILYGYPDGTFRPENSITRAETVTIANAMLGRKIDSAALAVVVNPYHDIESGHWVYAEIIEASVPHEYTRNADGIENWTSL